MKAFRDGTLMILFVFVNKFPTGRNGVGKFHSFCMGKPFEWLQLFLPLFSAVENIINRCARSRALNY